MDTLVQMRNNFDKPEEMANLKKRLSGEKWRENIERTVNWGYRCVLEVHKVKTVTETEEQEAKEELL